jgi:hypothetical protein
MTKPIKAAEQPPVTLSYQLIRNTTSPDETATGVKSFTVNLPALEILKLGTEDNLRAYIAEHNPKKRNAVHESIRATIENSPERFITRNSGFVIAAADVEVDDNKKIVKLFKASIINGAQSQGEIRRWVSDTFADSPSDAEATFHIRAEIIVDPDPQQVVETAIARNTASPVKSISQAGARKHLDDLQASVSAAMPALKIRMNETQLGEEYYDTRKLLQYARLLMPPAIAQNESPAEKLRPYKNPEQCLTEFSEWWVSRGTDPIAKAKYDFTVQIAPSAIKEYEYWETNVAWSGQNLYEKTSGGRACRRVNGKVVWVSPGIIFPIVGAMSEFVRQDSNKGWIIDKPDVFNPGEMISAAIKQFRGKSSDPYQMGRDPGAYDALRTYPHTLLTVMKALNR